MLQIKELTPFAARRQVDTGFRLAATPTRGSSHLAPLPLRFLYSFVAGFQVTDESAHIRQKTPSGEVLPWRIS